MPLKDFTLTGVIDKEKKAIERIKSFEPLQNGLFDTPYYVAYSGGKDSDVIRILCELAGVKYDLVHNHTTADAPETVRYIRAIPNIQINYPEMSMWRLIEHKCIPPTRLARYCCSVLKERGGEGRFVMTGVRWAESNNRKNDRGSVEIQGSSKKSNIILNADNDENRRMFENCAKKGKRILNPIVDWTDSDVWEFLKYYGCASNPLYYSGFNRVGCIGCPMAGKGRVEEFLKYPKYEANYIKAFDRMLLNRKHKGLGSSWKTGREVFDWWMDESRLPKEIDGQEILENW